MTEQQINAMIASATTQDDLGRIWQVLQQWLAANPNNSAAYQSLLANYNARYASITSGVVATPQPLGGAPIGGREEELGGFPAFLRALGGAGTPTAGPFAEMARGQYSPTMTAYRGTQAAAGAAVPGALFQEQPFTAWLAAQGQGGAPMGGLGAGRLGQTSQTAFNKMIGAMNTRDIAPAGWTAYMRQYGLPETGEEFGKGAGLGTTAATGRMGGLAAQYLMPSQEDLMARFLQSSEGKDASNWLPWLKRWLAF